MRRFLTAAVMSTVAGAVLIATAPAVSAQPQCTVTWTGPTVGEWEQASSWSTGKVPRHPRDRACLGSAALVTVTASRSVEEVWAGSTRLVAAAGVTLTATRQLVLDDGGALAGPGTFAAGFAWVRHGHVALAGAVNLDSLAARVERSDQVEFSDGSVWRNTGQFTLGTSAALLDTDGDVGNALVQRQGQAGYGLVVDRGARVEVPATVTGGVQATDYGQREPAPTLTLPRLTNETSDGVLHGGISLTAFAPITVPYPVTSLRNAAVAGAELRVDATGAPALTTLQSGVDAEVRLSESLDVTSPLTFTRSSLNVTGNLVQGVRPVLSAPSVTVADDSALYVTSGGVVRVGGGAGTVTVGRGTGDGPSTARLAAAEIDGSFVQQAGALDVDGLDVSHNVTLGGAVAVTATIDRPRAGTAQLPKLTVHGRATLAGALTVTYASGHHPAVGTAIRLIAVNGGVVGTFSTIQLPAGWTAEYDRRGLVITRVS